MSNIFSHNRLPFKCKLSYKDYWDFHLHLGREYGSVLPGMQTGCLSAFIDTTEEDCIDGTNLVSMDDYTYSECKSKGVELDNIGLTGMDNGSIAFDKNTITDEEFNHLFTETHVTIEEGDCKLHVSPVLANIGKYHLQEPSSYLTQTDCGNVAALDGGFYQGFFRTGDGCSYSVLPSDIGDGLSLEFELCRKELSEPSTSNSPATLNDFHPDNKGIFFYIGTRAENKWVRYYGDACDEEKEPEETELQTSEGTPLDKPTSNMTETDNKFVTYTRTCGGYTALDDKEGEPAPTAKIEHDNVILPDNPFTIFSRTCGGTTVLNFDEYLKEYAERYDIYSDLWGNALAFQITDDGKVGYRYLVKDCDAEDPNCDYKIEKQFSNPENVPYGEWVNIHVRILPVGLDKMRLMFYVNGRLVLYSRELPKLKLRELADSSDKQEGVPFNISLGGGTLGLGATIYEDWREIQQTYEETGEWPLPVYPLENEFGGSFIGYFKSFKFYSCSLNHTQINQNVNNSMTPCNDGKIYCGVLIFDTKPSNTPIQSQVPHIKLLNEYAQNVMDIELKLRPNIRRKYMRLVIAIPFDSLLSPQSVKDRMLDDSAFNLDEEGFEGVDIMDQLIQEFVEVDGKQYKVWYYTYATCPKYKDVISIKLKKIWK